MPCWRRSSPASLSTKGEPCWCYPDTPPPPAITVTDGPIADHQHIESFVMLCHSLGSIGLLTSGKHLRRRLMALPRVCQR